MTRNDEVKYYMCGMGSFEYMHNTWVIFILRVVERRRRRWRICFHGRKKKRTQIVIAGWRKNGQYQPGLDLNIASELV